jgi:DNA-binding winged helix-turn-helix (wHTH) protein
MKHLCEFGPYRLDFDRRLLLRGKDSIQLSAKALDILLVLVERSGEVVSKDDLMKEVWADAFVEEGNLAQNIHILRRVLGEKVDEHRYIVTVPGRGYRFVAEVREIAQRDSIPTKKDWVGKVVSWFRVRFKWRWTALIAGVSLVFVLVFMESLPVIARHYNNRGLELQQQGQIQAAIEHYQRALSLKRNYPEAHYNLGDAYEEIPNYDRALEEYQRAIDTDVSFYEAYNNLSRLYILRKHDYGAAMRLLDRALSLKPLEPSVRYSLYKNYGWANLELHQLGQAEQNLKFAVALDANRGAAHCLLAKVLNLQSRGTEEWSEWDACVAYSGQGEVEAEWRNEAVERLSKKERGK